MPIVIALPQAAIEQDFELMKLVIFLLGNQQYYSQKGPLLCICHWQPMDKGFELMPLVNMGKVSTSTNAKNVLLVSGRVSIMLVLALGSNINQ